MPQINKLNIVNTDSRVTSIPFSILSYDYSKHFSSSEIQNINSAVLGFYFSGGDRHKYTLFFYEEKSINASNFKSYKPVRALYFTLNADNRTIRNVILG